MTIARNSFRCRSLLSWIPVRPLMTLQLGGGLLTGASTIDAGYHVWNEHKERGEEEVSFIALLF